MIVALLRKAYVAIVAVGSAKSKASRAPRSAKATLQFTAWKEHKKLRTKSETNFLPPFQQLQSRGCGMQFGLGPVPQHSQTPSLHHSDTPSLRVAGFEDSLSAVAPHSNCANRSKSASSGGRGKAHSTGRDGGEGGRTTTRTRRKPLQLCLIRVAQNASEQELAGLVIRNRE
jgi:hypothetical protein